MVLPERAASNHDQLEFTYLICFSCGSTRARGRCNGAASFGAHIVCRPCWKSSDCRSILEQNRTIVDA